MISETIRHETMGTLYVYDTLDDIDQSIINPRTMLLTKSEFDDLYNDKKPEGNALLDFLGLQDLARHRCRQKYPWMNTYTT